MASPEDLEKTIRDIVRSSIKRNGNPSVFQESMDVDRIMESLDTDTVARYASNWASLFGWGGALLAAAVTIATGGSFSLAMIAGGSAGVVSAISGFFVGYRNTLVNQDVYNALMNSQIASKFDDLVKTVEKRDAIFSEFPRFKTVSERNAYQKRVGNEIKKLGARMKKLSFELRSDLLEIGDELDVNEYDREKLMAFLEKGEKAAISEVMSDRRKVEKIANSVNEDIHK